MVEMSLLLEDFNIHGNVFVHLMRQTMQNVFLEITVVRQAQIFDESTCCGSVDDECQEGNTCYMEQNNILHILIDFLRSGHHECKR